MPLTGSIPGCDSGFFEYEGAGAILAWVPERLIGGFHASLERMESGVVHNTDFPGAIMVGRGCGLNPRLE